MSDLFYEEDLAAHRAAVRAMEEVMNDRARDIRANIRNLADDARPTSEEDWGSDRQVDAENAFFSAVDRLLHPHQRDALEAYALKGTTEENIEYALRLLSLDPANGHA